MELGGGRGEGREWGVQATQQSCPQPLPMFSLSLGTLYNLHSENLVHNLT